MDIDHFPTGTRVRFKPLPWKEAVVEATVTGVAARGFLVTKDDAGKERKVRPSFCEKLS